MQLKRTSRKNFRKDIAKPVRGYEDGGWRDEEFGKNELKIMKLKKECILLNMKVRRWLRYLCLHVVFNLPTLITQYVD
tara:strand:- start:102 stop:335 length:234 start_codon:yes stop_codon:yes gene_type:complete